MLIEFNEINEQIGSGEEYRQPHDISVLHRRLIKRLDVDGRDTLRPQSDTNNSNNTSNSNNSNNNDAVAAAAAAIISRGDAAKSPGQEPCEQVNFNEFISISFPIYYIYF